MPRGVRGLVAGCEAVARVTVRTMRTLVGGRRRREEEDLGEKETVWGEIKVERKAEEAAIFVSLEIVWRKKQKMSGRRVLRYPLVYFEFWVFGVLFICSLNLGFWGTFICRSCTECEGGF